MQLKQIDKNRYLVVAGKIAHYPSQGRENPWKAECNGVVRYFVTLEDAKIWISGFSKQ